MLKPSTRISVTVSVHHYGNGIADLLIRRGSRQAVDEFMMHLEGIVNDSPTDKPIRLLIDRLVADDLPVKYLFQRMSDFDAVYFDRQPMRVAILEQRSVAHSLIHPFIQFAHNRQDNARLFESRPAATAWLLGDN